MAQDRKEPQRTCIACRRIAPKSELLRIVKGNDGAIAYDASGKRAGRGAYICNIACYEKARSRGLFNRALRTKVKESDHCRIEEDLTSDLAGR